MELTDFFGAINTVFIIVSLYGVMSQLKTIWQRKKQSYLDGSSTSLLSLNQFTVSFFAYLSFFIYGYSIEPFNHYMVWPRLAASILIGWILYEIWRDRRTTLSLLAMGVSNVFLCVSIAGLVISHSLENVVLITDQGKVISTVLIVLVSAFIAQGYYHQIKLIVNSGHTGAVDIKLSQFIFMMDVSTFAFALSMGLDQGWPLLVLAITSGITKLVIMYLFRWVRLSPVAAKRREILT